ncbi:MAG: hypothetical protein Q9163_000807 [Psora crenata]
MSDYGGDDADDGYDYEPQEPAYDDEEPFSPHDPDSPSYATSNAQTPAPAHADPDAQAPTTNGATASTPGPATNGADGRAVVEVNGDGAPAQRKAGVGSRQKKIPDEKRSTTPYMTKYERARVLGTRALQIRYDSLTTLPAGNGA